jgi:hypothetical protein
MGHRLQSHRIRLGERCRRRSRFSMTVRAIRHRPDAAHRADSIGQQCLRSSG